jgi:polysaccharide biosynthesis protein PslA
MGALAKAQEEAAPAATHASVCGWRGTAKRALDIIVALNAILVFSPVFILVPILIKLEDPGPVFFRQKRFGYGNKLFDCLKFRSMYVKDCSSDEIRLTERIDPRVTRIGKFIRRTSLDELPQFLNVLKGDMSVVGPRPHPPGVKAGERTYEEVIPHFADRYQVKPGLTGLAQVKGARGNTFAEADIERRFGFDMEYIRNWSLLIDISIILRTFLIGFVGKNAF